MLIKRASKDPIIIPDKNNFWESKATFNPGAIYLEDKVHILYRAMSDDNTSVLGYASSKDGIHIDDRLSEPVYVPRELFEQKLIPNENSGCEDPRLVKIEDKIYMLYTAYDGKNPPRVALTWINVGNFLQKKWEWAKPVLISPPGVSDKDAFIFSEKINGQYMFVHRLGDTIDFSFSETLDFKNGEWLEENRWIAPREGWWDSKKVGAAAPAIKTNDGWLMLYHGISDDGIYRVGAVLLDLNDPTKIISRTDDPIFEPEVAYEKNGQVPNVVFPGGVALIGENIFIYYGGGDGVTGVAVVGEKELASYLKASAVIDF